MHFMGTFIHSQLEAVQRWESSRTWDQKDSNLDSTAATYISFMSFSLRSRLLTIKLN